MLLSKSKKHFVGITWVDGEKKGGFVMQCDKDDYRGILLGLEGVTGKKAVDSDAMTVKNYCKHSNGRSQARKKKDGDGHRPWPSLRQRLSEGR
jgi:hypothetical protein